MLCVRLFGVSVYVLERGVPQRSGSLGVDVCVSWRCCGAAVPSFGGGVPGVADNAPARAARRSRIAPHSRGWRWRTKSSAVSPTASYASRVLSRSMRARGGVKRHIKCDSQIRADARVEVCKAPRPVAASAARCSTLQSKTPARTIPKALLRRRGSARTRRAAHTRARA